MTQGDNERYMVWAEGCQWEGDMRVVAVEREFSSELYVPITVRCPQIHIP